MPREARAAEEREKPRGAPPGVREVYEEYSLVLRFLFFAAHRQGERPLPRRLLQRLPIECEAAAEHGQRGSQALQTRAYIFL